MPRKNELDTADALALAELASVLRDSREQARLSRSKLARIAELCEHTIEQIELGRQRPARKTCQKLFKARKLRIPWSYFEPFAGALAAQEESYGKEMLPPSVRVPLERLGRVLLDRRGLASLTRLALAKRTGLSEATIKHVEKATFKPSRRTCLKLYVLGGLQLEWLHFEPLAGSQPVVPQPEYVSGFAALVPDLAGRLVPMESVRLLTRGENSGCDGISTEVQVIVQTPEVQVAIRLTPDGTVRSTAA